MNLHGPTASAQACVPRESSQQAVSRILFAFAHLRTSRRFGGLRRDDHSSSLAITGEIQRPTRKLRTGRPSGEPARLVPGASLFGLAPCGVLPATDLTTGAVRSYRTFSPLPTSALRATVGKPREVRTFTGSTHRSARSARRRAVYFLCHCPSGRPDRALPGALPCGVRTFLPPSRPSGATVGKPLSGLPSEATERAKAGGRLACCELLSYRGVEDRKGR